MTKPKNQMFQIHIVDWCVRMLEAIIFLRDQMFTKVMENDWPESSIVDGAMQLQCNSIYI